MAGSVSTQPTSDGSEQRYDPGTLTQTVPGSHGDPPAVDESAHSLTSKYTAHAIETCQC